MTEQTNGTATETGAENNGTDELAGLGEDDLRRVAMRYRAEAAGRRHETAEAREAERLANERVQALEREHETERDRVVREAVEHALAERDALHAQALAGKDRDIATMGARSIAAELGFADPDDGVRLLGADDLLAGVDGQRKALAALLESKPYLAREQRRGSVVTQGARSQTPDGRTRERSWLRQGLT